MSTKICLNNVACYKTLVTLESDKKVNLIYGLNGTGKSTFSDFLYNSSKPCFSNCTIDGLSGEEVLVYNQSFVKDYFYESDNLKGIFTLSKENKEAEENVRKAEQEINKLETEKKKDTDAIDAYKRELTQKKLHAENKAWEIKAKFAGGDRVLEYCLSGLMGRKEALFRHLSSFAKPSQKPSKTTDQLKKEVEELKGSTAQKHDLLPTINFTAHNIESNELFGKMIVGNENSSISELIKKLGNSDWVKQGLDYLPEEIGENGESCPFCQERTINKSLFEKIQNYFDETYEKSINELKKLLAEYDASLNLIPIKETFKSNPYITEKKNEFESLHNTITQSVRNNKDRILEKIKSASQAVSLTDTSDAISVFNQFIENINKAIKEHNNKIDNKDDSLEKTKNQFWNIMRWDYDQTISAFESDKVSIEAKIRDLNNQITLIDKKIAEQKNVVIEQQKKTINIDEAIANINSGLIDLGIDGFRIDKQSDTLYKIVREEQSGNTFQTLSEGEKMIISFLYFRELCKGKKSATSHAHKKIVVIDDPISSLSHIYIFNIGQLIKNEFFKSPNYDQIFVLTHSLYFFYELTETKHDRREQTQKLFRMIKNSDGSQILEMKYEEIQNDYQSYWFVVKDDKQPPALIANCMRNIIEYFFSFIEKKDLNNVFQKPEFQKTKFQAFRRYIDRESHSVGQNVFDIKEFNYVDFKEAFGLVFAVTGYKDHYDAMMK